VLNNAHPSTNTARVILGHVGRVQSRSYQHNSQTYSLQTISDLAVLRAKTSTYGPHSFAVSGQQAGAHYLNRSVTLPRHLDDTNKD